MQLFYLAAVVSSKKAIPPSVGYKKQLNTLKSINASSSQLSDLELISYKQFWTDRLDNAHDHLKKEPSFILLDTLTVHGKSQ